MGKHVISMDDYRVAVFKQALNEVIAAFGEIYYGAHYTSTEQKGRTSKEYHTVPKFGMEDTINDTL